jgi:HEAT repeat protein
MGFDYQNFGIGLVSGWATAYAVYRARHRIRTVVQFVNRRASSAQNFATQSTDSRYVDEIIRFAQRNHLAGGVVPLSDVVVEPRFIGAAPLAAPPEDDVIQNLFDIIPRVPDMPHLQAPYNIPTLSIDDLGTGDQALALLGTPGSGRTTAMMTILLKALGKLHFAAEKDVVQQRLDAEDAALDAKQRAVRVKDRLLLEQRARERLAEERGMAFEVEAGSEGIIPRFNRLMPVYIHLADIHHAARNTKHTMDPAELLVEVVRRQLGRIAASTIPGNLYTRLNRGQVLVMVDGYDELTEEARGRALTWLKTLKDYYPRNFYLISGPIHGYGALVQHLGLTPVYLRPWSADTSHRFYQQWVNSWEKGSTRKESRPKPSSEVLDKIAAQAPVSSPLQRTIGTWSLLANEAPNESMEDGLAFMVRRHLTTLSNAEGLDIQLMVMAALQLDEGYITVNRLEALLREAAPDGLPTQKNKDGSSTALKTEQIVPVLTQLVRQLQKTGLLIYRRGGRYQFHHMQIAAYLGSLWLRRNPEQVSGKSTLPQWKQAVAFSNFELPLDDVVRQRLGQPADLNQDILFEIAEWLRYAPADAGWRESYLKYLSNLLLAPNQFQALRERATAALAHTNDPDVDRIFRQASRSPIAPIRLLGALGLGVSGSDNATLALSELMRDENPAVQLAAAFALGAIQTETSLTTLVDGFTEGSELLRQGIAETFAGIPEEGYPILHDAIKDSEMLIRRAAVFGLKRLRSDWAMMAIYQAFLEDNQWYVRSAAQTAFHEIQNARSLDRGAHGYPPVESIHWLNEWAAARGENVLPGEEAMQMLEKALREGDPDVRSYAALNIGQMGVFQLIQPLYSLLRDKREDVRDTAYRALGNLQAMIGKPLPNPLG